MSVQELLKEVARHGVALWAEPPDLCIAPASQVPLPLKDELRAHKAEILEFIRTTPHSDEARLTELEAKRRRLEDANVSVAILPDGTMQIVKAAEINQSTKDGRVVYSPADMYYRALLSPHEQALLHQFKRNFPGSTQWMSTEEAARRSAHLIPARDDHSEWPDFSKQPQKWRCSRCKIKGEGTNIADVIEEHTRRSPGCSRLCVTLGNWRDVGRRREDDDGIRPNDEVQGDD